VLAVFRRFLGQKSGATAIEYCLIAGLASVAVIAGAKLIGVHLNDAFSSIAGYFP
jgi:pilus assembly protein Flp/PilA